MTNFVTARFHDRSTPPHVFTLMLLAGVSALAMNMFLPSLPIMAEYFGVDYSVMQLSVPLYLAVSALMQILIGPISDKFGRRIVIGAGFTMFVLFSLGCLVAPTVTIFLLCRMGQAFAVVGIVLGRAVIRDVHDGDKAASLIGWVTMGMAVVPMIAPAIGGALDELFGWQSVFWAFIACGLLAVYLTWADLGETARPSSLTIGQQFRQYPELLTSPRFWGYTLAAAFASGAFFAYLGGAPFVGSEIFGLSPSALGIYFGAPAVGYAIGNGFTGLWSARFGINAMILSGTIITLAGIALSLLLFLVGAGSAMAFFGPMTIVGVGNGLVLPNANAGLLSVRPHLAGTASGLGGAFMIGGGAALAALAGALLRPETGALPLLWLQLLTCFAALLAILSVYHRERRLKRDG